jgi:hypothetical protein
MLCFRNFVLKKPREKEASVSAVLFWIVVISLARLVRYLRTKPARLKQRGLCAGCAFVHMQYGATGRNAVFCTFRGGVRAVKLDVLYCTDYRNRYARPRLVQVGFAPEARTVEIEG